MKATARWLIEQEARALLTRLGRVRPFALQETMVPAAALSPAAQIAIERFLIGNRYALREEVLGYLRWLKGEGVNTSPEEMQRRFTIVRLRFNDALTQFDVFSELVTQRSEHETGVWLSGLDAFAADALALPGDYLELPQVVCYLARGPGAAIRRARTRLPGGGRNPVAIVRVPRERMIGHGIASSLVHEVGHQGAALLELVGPLRAALRRQQTSAPPGERPAWALWERWISEIVADLWSVGKLGIGSTLGLIGVVSLPRWFVFRVNADDPHPIPWLRVKVSCAMGNALYPHPQWGELAAVWESLYPTARLGPEHRRLIASLEATLPRFVALIVNHRPRLLRGTSLKEVLTADERRPERLTAYARTWRSSPDQMRQAPPSLAFAVLGQARAVGGLTPEAESRALGNLLTYWALRTSLDMNEICAAPATRRMGSQRPPQLQAA
jgi:hypothetical protein